MGQCTFGSAGDVVRGDVIAAGHHRERSSQRDHCHTCSCGRSKTHASVGACGVQQFDRIVSHGFGEVHLLDRSTACCQLIGCSDLLHMCQATTAAATSEYLDLLRCGGTAEADCCHEAIGDTLRERVSAHHLDWVLRRQHHERCRHRMGVAVDTDAALFHHFQQGRLCARVGAVQLVEQDHVGKHRAGSEVQSEAIGVGCQRTDHIGWQEICRPLHSCERPADRSSDGLRQQRLAHAGDVFQQHVATGENARGDHLNLFTATCQHRCDAVVEGGGERGGGRGCWRAVGCKSEGHGEVSSAGTSTDWSAPMTGE
ncbi:unannotated protein [freshwater metagenome]|uniref:Unannotated protein n=1 Tax=freshwater metagenome TaxID=449393 RepID=A0A6J7C5U2_9ZZZZ